MEALPGAKPTDPMYAVFPDGTQGPIFEWTVESWMMKDTSNDDDRFRWTGVLAEAAHHITVRFRQGRSLLACIFEQSKQILQVRADEFRDLVSDEEATKARAYMFMKTIAEEYIDGIIKKDDLKQVRDERINAVRLEKKSVQKKPARRVTWKRNLVEILAAEKTKTRKTKPTQAEQVEAVETVAASAPKKRRRVKNNDKVVDEEFDRFINNLEVEAGSGAVQRPQTDDEWAVPDVFGFSFFDAAFN